LAAIALLAAALMTATYAAKAAGQAQPVPAPFRLVPAKSAGRLLLGATPAQIHAILGKPHTTRRWRTGLLDEEWPGTKAQSNDVLPSAIVLYRGGKAVQIEVAAPRFSTAQGISVKTTFREIRRRFPHLRASEYLYADWFEINYDDVRQGI